MPKLLPAVVVLVVLTSAVSWFFFRANGNYWTTHVIYSGPCCTDGTRLSDFDLDGQIDIVTSIEESGAVAILFKQAPGAWSPILLTRKDLIKRAEDSLPVDIDNDGYMDLLISQENRSEKHTVCFNPGHLGDARDPDKWDCEIVPATHGLKTWSVAESLPLADGDRAFVIGGK